jgi:hypothetical protein
MGEAQIARFAAVAPIARLEAMSAGAFRPGRNIYLEAS